MKIVYTCVTCKSKFYSLVEGVNVVKDADDEYRCKSCYRIPILTEEQSNIPDDSGKLNSQQILHN